MLTHATRSTLLAAVVVAVVSVGSPGCQAVDKVIVGQASTVVAATTDRVGPIAEAVVREKGLADVQATVTQLDAVITGTTAEGKTITVTVTPAGADTAEVAVSNKAGKLVAQNLLREIEERVKDVSSKIDPAPADGVRFIPAPPSTLQASDPTGAIPPVDEADATNRPPHPFD